MNVDTAFPSKYLKAADLAGKTVRLKISSIEIEKLGEDMRPVLSFEKTAKALVLNKTNANRIALGFKSKEMDDWIGQEIEAYPDMVDYQGRLVEAIRVRVPLRTSTTSVAPHPGMNTTPAQRATVAGHLDAPPPASETDYGAILDDEVPF